MAAEGGTQQLQHQLCPKGEPIDHLPNFGAATIPTAKKPQAASIINQQACLYFANFTYEASEMLLKNQSSTEFSIDPKKYAAVLLNCNDENFAKVKLDSISQDFFIANLGKVESAISRAVLWRSFFESVRDAEFSPALFVSLVNQNIETEKENSIVQLFLDMAQTTISQFIRFSEQKKQQNLIFNTLDNIFRNKFESLNLSFYF